MRAIGLLMWHACSGGSKSGGSVMSGGAGAGAQAGQGASSGGSAGDGGSGTVSSSSGGGASNNGGSSSGGGSGGGFDTSTPIPVNKQGVLPPDPEVDDQLQAQRLEAIQGLATRDICKSSLGLRVSAGFTSMPLH